MAGLDIKNIKARVKKGMTISMLCGEHTKEERKYRILDIYPSFAVCEDVLNNTKSSFMYHEIALHNPSLCCIFPSSPGRRKSKE